MKRFLFYVITLLAGLWLQLLLHHTLGENRIASQGLLVGVIYWGLSRGPIAGQLIGFFWGLLLDAASMGTLGMTAWLWTLAGFVSGTWRRELDETKIWTQSIFTFILSASLAILGILLERLWLPGNHSGVWARALEPFWNAAIAPVVFRVLWAWDTLWDMREVES